MFLFVSDMHFGRTDDLAAERQHERDLIACLRTYEADVRGLYLVGDVFDQYVEYRHLVPKGFVRFQGLLAAWTDRGVPVVYLVGNHDLWHGDYFRSELGVRVVSGALVEPLCGRRVYIAHGDGLPEAPGLYKRIKPLLRHPLPVALYKTLLPGDAGMRLARWTNRHVRNDEVEAQQVEAQRRHARHLLQTSAADLVVMGHSHHPEERAWPEGHYTNLGSWYLSRTLGRLDPKGLALLRWDGTSSAPFAGDADPST